MSGGSRWMRTITEAGKTIIHLPALGFQELTRQMQMLRLWTQHKSAFAEGIRRSAIYGSMYLGATTAGGFANIGLQPIFENMFPKNLKNTFLPPKTAVEDYFDILTVLNLQCSVGKIGVATLNAMNSQKKSTFKVYLSFLAELARLTWEVSILQFMASQQSDGQTSLMAIREVPSWANYDHVKGDVRFRIRLNEVETIEAAIPCGDHLGKDPLKEPIRVSYAEAVSNLKLSLFYVKQIGKNENVLPPTAADLKNIRAFEQDEKQKQEKLIREMKEKLKEAKALAARAKAKAKAKESKPSAVGTKDPQAQTSAKPKSQQPKTTPPQPKPPED